MKRSLKQRSWRSVWPWPAALFLITCCYAHAAASPPQVLEFSPQGTVKAVRQVKARFSEPMVPLGDPRLPSPFEIDCAKSGAGHWIDSRNWVYDFAEDLPAGIRCSFRVRPDLTALAGASFPDHPEFSFSTGGPAVLSSVPYDGDESIDEEQAFVLSLDADATEASIIKNASFAVAGVAERIGSKIVTGDRRQEILGTFARETFSGPVVILQAERPFPNATEVRLVWGKGIESNSAVPTIEDQILKFKTRAAFTADFRCERENATAGCVPLTAMRVAFSGPVSWEQARHVALTGPGDFRRDPDPPSEPGPDVEGVEFHGPFPESAAFQISLPENLRDISGRALVNSATYPLTIKTDKLPPLAKFSSRFGILEKADPVLPVTMRNLEPQVAGAMMAVAGQATRPKGLTLSSILERIEATVWRVPPGAIDQIQPWLRTLALAHRDHSLFDDSTKPHPLSFKLPKPNGAKAFEVVGIPLKKTGLYIVELKSDELGAALLGDHKPIYVPTAALVTNLAVHFKWGRERSLVWVTTLDHGKPVKNAYVAVQDCQGKVLWKGVTDASGISWVDSLPDYNAAPHCDWQSEFDVYEENAGRLQSLRGLDSGLMVTAQKGEDLSFVHSSWERGIESWRFHLPFEYRPNPVEAHTVLDRALFRAGETVHMKHFIRVKSLSGLSQLEQARLPQALSIRHVGSDEHYDFPLDWSSHGTAETTWQIPAQAKLGSYELNLIRRAGGAKPTPANSGDDRDLVEWQLTSADFRVEEFRVPLMKATVQTPAKLEIRATEIPVDLSVQYLSGGGARKLPVTLRSQLSDLRSLEFPDFKDFTFANGVVKEGVIRRGANYEAPEEEAGKPGVHQRLDLVLDENGVTRTSITEIPRKEIPVEVLAELEYRDPNGETQTASNTFRIWPARRLVGIRPKNWVSSRNQVGAEIAVVDLEGHPVSDAPVAVALFEQKTYSARKRVIGGFYAYESVQETRRLSDFCGGKTDSHGLFECRGAPPVTGNLVLEATVTDPDGNNSVAHGELWVPGGGRWWFEEQDDDRIDLLPEKKHYEPGETARFQVRMPFSEATALVAVENESVRAAWVVQLSGREPVIQVPIQDYAPNVFVSVLAVRGRVSGVQPTAMVDLGKPSFKLGIAEIDVGWREHELKVTVSPDREVYQVRQKALVKISVRTAEGKTPPAGADVALAAVDEGLLELQPNESWNLLEAMMGRRAYLIHNATAQMQVVGKRHFGLKALPQGGGGGRGGRQITRQLFNTLLLWQASVPLNADGVATVEVPLNDSLTSFRIVAVASAGEALFGTGSASIRSTQDLIVMSGISPLARVGDRFTAEFTVRNSTEHKLSVSVDARVKGIKQQLSERELALEPGAADVAQWDIEAPAGVDELAYTVEAAAPGGPSDRVAVAQRVIPVVAVRTYQATLERLDKPIEEKTQRPPDAVPGAGGLQLAISPKLAVGLSTVRDWMRQYPYGCLEQKVSLAVALPDEHRWKDLTATMPSYADQDGLLKYFPTMESGSDILTSYVLAITTEAGLKLPPDVEKHAEQGLIHFVDGSLSRGSEIGAADLTLRKLAALEALSRVGKVSHQLVGTISIDPNLWPTSAVLDWWSVLLRTKTLPDRGKRLTEAAQIIKSRLTMQGATMGFSTESSDRMWWLMASPETNAVRLLLVLLEAGEWRDDLPRLMTGAIARQTHGSWNSTITNAWGTLALEKFSRIVEAAPVTGSAAVSLSAGSQHLEWKLPPDGKSIFTPWLEGPSELRVEQHGAGAPWLTISSLAAIPLKAPLSQGYRITKSITSIEPLKPGSWSRGDFARVRLQIDAESDMTWVVVNDPIPAGASHIGTGLRRGPQIVPASSEDHEDQRLWPTYEERPFDSYRAYYEYVPKGTFVVEHTIRLNQSGSFQLPATRVEAIYQPATLGELPNAPFEVPP